MKIIALLLTVLSTALYAGEVIPPSQLPNHYVGELQKTWQFPSDHLPVGATIDDFHVATWNVLNSAYIDWIEKNTQGLSMSLIIDEHYVRLNEWGLTLREEHLVQNILKMVQHPTHPRSIIALQECGTVFLQELTKRLPKHMKIHYSSEKPAIDQNVIIYDSKQFKLLEDESRIVPDAYPCNPGRTLMDIVFLKKSTKTKYRFVNTHLPGDPNLPGRFEFAHYIAGHRTQDRVTVLLGDMNFNPEMMESAFHGSLVHTFKNLVSYYTIVGTDKSAKAYDHIYVDFGKKAGKASPNAPREVLPELESTVSLLEHR